MITSIFVETCSNTITSNNQIEIQHTANLTSIEALKHHPVINAKQLLAPTEVQQKY